jgi:hypothetical protein
MRIFGAHWFPPHVPERRAKALGHSHAENSMNRRVISIAILILTGCATNTGPFVTNITTDGHGTIVVEKCMTNTMHYPDLYPSETKLGNCTSTTLRVTP